MLRSEYNPLTIGEGYIEFPSEVNSMAISEPILAGLLGAAAVVLVALVSAWGHINSRLGKVEKGQEALTAEIRASRDRSDMQHAELLSEIRLWRTHGHDADGAIFFRVPE
jgi:hypothetical protein